MLRRMTSFALLAISTVVACTDRHAPESEGVRPGKGNKVVARIGNRVITEREIQQALRRQSNYVQTRFTSKERRRDFTKSYLRREVLAEEARRRGLDRDPEVVSRVRRVMVARLRELLDKELVSFSEVSEEDVRAYYRQHKRDYMQPAQVRLSRITTRSRPQAEAVLKELRPAVVGSASTKGAVSALAASFARLARTQSVDSYREQGGDMGYLSENAKDVEPLLLRAAFQTTERDKLVGPIEAKGGYVILLRTGYRAAKTQSLGAVRGSIQNKLFDALRARAFERYVEKLEKTARVEVNQTRLKALRAKLEQEEPLQPQASK